ncbi:hypothetical protein FBU30_002869, partial [Linnemannia zychae]
HMSRGCTNDRVERMPMATGANAVPVAERNGARRVQSVSLSQSYVTTKTTRNSSGAIQQRRQERANLPVGPSSHMRSREPNEAITAADARMEWQEQEVEAAAINIEPIPAAGTRVIESTTATTADPLGAKPKRARYPVEPDRVFVESIEGLSFDMQTIAKHSGKVATQLKAAVNTVWTRNRPPRKPRKAKASLVVPTGVSRRALCDVTTVVVRGLTFNNAIIDPGNDKTMMGSHVARALDIQLSGTNQGIMMADGRTRPLEGRSGLIDFYVKGIGGRMDMGVVDCRKTYDFLLGSDWLHYIKAQADYETGVYYVKGQDGKRVVLGRPPDADEDSEEDREDEEDDDHLEEVYESEGDSEEEAL